MYNPTKQVKGLLGGVMSRNVILNTKKSYILYT